MPGGQIASRYVPGSGIVGGDWYDVFVLPSGELGVVIGDVAGSACRAIVMGRMRSALRAYALETTDPAEVLDRLDRKMQHFEPRALATVLYAVIDPALDWAHIASAGHLPPVVAVPGETASLVDIAGGLMIGVDARARRQATTVKIDPRRGAVPVHRRPGGAPGVSPRRGPAPVVPRGGGGAAGEGLCLGHGCPDRQ